MPKNRGTDAQLLTMHELATYLHLDEATVSKLVMQGKIPSLQVDRQWRFKPHRINGQPIEFETQITVNFALS